MGGCLANTNFYSSIVKDNAGDLRPTASGFPERPRSQSLTLLHLRGWPWQHGRQNDGVGAHLNYSVWHKREVLQFGQHKYVMVQTRQFKTNRSGSPPEDVIKQEPNKSDSPQTQSQAPAHSPVSKHSGWVRLFV